MKCKNCNMLLDSGERSCKNCGAFVQEENIELLDVETIDKDSLLSEIHDKENEFLDIENMDSEIEENKTTSSKKIGIFPFLGGVICGIFVMILSGSLFFLAREQVNQNDSIENQIVMEDGTQKLAWEGYHFTIPKEIKAEIVSSCLTLHNEENTWKAEIRATTYPYTVIQSNLTQVQVNASRYGFTSSNAKEIKIGNDSYSVLEVTYGMQNYLVAYKAFNPNTVFYFYIYNTTNTFDYDHVKEVAKVLKTVKFEGGNQNLSSNISLDTVDLFIR